MTAFAQCARHLQNRHPTIPRYGPKNPIYRAAHSFFISPPVTIEHAGRTPLAQGAGPDSVSRYRTQGGNAMAQRVGDALKGLTVTDLRQQAAFKAADLRPLGLQFLGRRQLVDVYGGMLPELRIYSDLMARMDADKNEAGAGADQLANDWAKLPDERQLAELMHDATLAQMDPARDYVDGDNRMKYGELHRRFEALSPAARDVYTRARDTYRQHMRDVRTAIKERIERAEMSSERRAAMLKRLDDEFFGHIKGVYFPLARFGQYVVVVKGADGKVANVSRAETMAEADTMRRQLLAAFPQAEGFTVGKVLKAKDFVAERDSVGRGFMEQLYGVLDKQGMAPQQRAELEDALGQLYLSSLPDLSWAKHGIHRKGRCSMSAAVAERPKERARPSAQPTQEIRGPAPNTASKQFFLPSKQFDSIFMRLSCAETILQTLVHIFGGDADTDEPAAVPGLMGAVQHVQWLLAKLHLEIVEIPSKLPDDLRLRTFEASELIDVLEHLQFNNNFKFNRWADDWTCTYFDAALRAVIVAKEALAKVGVEQ